MCWLVDIGRLVLCRAANWRDALALAVLDAGEIASVPVVYRLHAGKIVEVIA